MAARIVPQKKLTGAELAQLALDAIPKDRTGTSLREHIGEAQTTFGDTDEFTVFCATLQNALRRPPAADVPRYLDEATSFILAIRDLAEQQICQGCEDTTGAVTLSIQALAEKSGYLCDKSLVALRSGPACVGDYDDWANLKRKAPEAEAAAE